METDQINTTEFRLLLLIAILLIGATIVSSSGIYPGLSGNIIAFFSYIAFLFFYSCFIKGINLPRTPVVAFGILYFVFIIGFIRDSIGLFDFPSSYVYPTSTMSALTHTSDLVGYIIGSFTLLFVLPQIIERDLFFRVLVTISTLSIFLGLPAYIIGDYVIAGVYIGTYTSLEPFRQYDIYIPALASFWVDANAMSKIAVAGLLGSHYLYTRRQSMLRFILIIVNGFGLFIANSMMAMIAVVLSYSVYFVYRYFGKKTTLVYLITSGTIGAIFFLMILAGIGTSTVGAKIGFSGRTELWQAAVYTFFQHPFIGVGIHNVGEVISAYTSASPIAPQNSYLRIFVAGGIIGGLAYVGIITRSVFDYLQEDRTNLDILTLCLLISFLLIQFSDTSDPFGINKNALIFTATLGYVLKGTYTECYPLGHD